MGLDLPSAYYGIFFDVTEDGKSCADLANSDIAGIGVVLSFVIASFLTTIASIAAAVLDSSTKDDAALLPSRLQDWLSKGLTESQLLNRRMWRRVLDRLILAFADQQLVTGFALLVSGFTSVFPGLVELHFRSAHWSLVVYMACLSSSTHLACVLTLRKYFETHKTSAIARIVLIVIFSLSLIPAICLSYTFRVFLIPLRILVMHELEQGRSPDLVNGLWFTIQACAYFYLFYTAVMQLFLRHHPKIKKWKMWAGLRKILGFQYISFAFNRLLGKRAHAWLTKTLAKSFWYFLFLSPATVFVLQIFFAATSLVFTLAQKFAKPREGIVEGDCSLNSPADNNTLGFGQLLALAFLALPVFLAYECYTEEKHEMKHQEAGVYAPINSDVALLPLTPARPPSGASSYFQYSPAQTPEISHQPSSQLEGGLLSPPISYFGYSDYSRL